MPRAYDRYPTARGMGRDSLYSPTRGGLPWQNPLEAITGTATDTIGAIGGFLRTALALEQLEQAFAEFAGEFTGVADGGPLDWDIPETIRVAIAAAAKLGVDIGAWLVQVFKNITRIDLTEHSQFLKDLLALLAFADLQEAWDTFLSGWTALDWGSPLTAMHPGWKLVVDFAWDVADWSAQVLANITGISWPGFLGLDALRGHWAAFSTAWEAVNWANPLTGIHGAWMALVDLAWNLWDWALTVLRNLTGIEIPNFLDIDTLKGLWQQFTDAWAAITWSSLTAIWSAISAVGNLLRQGTHWLIGVIRNLTGIDLEPIAESFGITALVDAVTTWADTLAGINWLSPGALMAAIGAFIALAQALGNWVLGVINAWLGWDSGIVHDMFGGVGPFVEKIVEFFWGETGVAGWIHAVESLAGEVGASIVDAITAVYHEATRLAQAIGSFTGLGGLVDFVEGVIGPDGLQGWLDNLPFLGPLVKALTGAAEGGLKELEEWVEQVPLIGDIVSRLTNLTPADGVSLDLSQLGAWAKKLLLNDSPIDAGNLIGQIPQALLGMLPVANINVASANLLSQGDFKNAGTVEAASGWSWDPYTNDDALGTGSAKLITNGTNNWLYSRQAVPVAGGDKVKLSARVKTSGYSGASNSIVLAVVPFVGSTAQTPKVFATRGASNGSFVTMTGSGDSNPYVVPAGVTSLIVRVGVTSGSGSGSTVWFDKLDMRKDGLLGQNLVEYLLSAWEGAWGAVFGGSGVGKVWSDFVTALSTLNFTAGQGVSKGDTAQGLGLGIIDSIGKAVFGEGTYNTLSSQVKSALQFLFGKLFGLPTVQDELQSAAIPPLSGSVIQDGEISIDHIPSADIGAAILPGAGSGAMLTRQAGSTSKVTVASGRNKLPTGFYDTLTNSSPDITASMSGSSYTGTFVVGLDGWYLAEIGLRVDPGWGGGYNLAPLLYKGATPFKVGMDAHQAFGDGSPERYAQSSFIIYLTAGQSVSAGTDTKASYTNILSADTGGIETYFSLSLLNRSYA